MLVYKAIYKFLPDGVHGEVIDFPGVITCGKTIGETRRLLAGALEDMAETCIMLGEPLPVPDPSSSAPEADLDEPIHLMLRASTRVSVRPKATV